MRKFVTIAAIIAAAQIAGGAAFASTSADPDIEKAKEKASVVRTAPEGFATRIVEDAKLPSGVEVVVQEGKEGEKTFFQAYENLLGTDGGFTSVPILYEKVTTLPTEKVIRRGANTLVIDGISDKTKDAEKAKAAAKLAEEERAKAAAQEEAKAEAAAAARQESATTYGSSTQSSPRVPATAPASTGVTSPEENKAYARSILSPADFTCLNFIAQKESNWSTTATNSSSGAYGVAQSLPASKMASAGADYRTNGKTQVNWMISYLNERYGSPCGGKAFWDINHWY